ncbi:interleukin-18-like [Hyla sarda]|uniref:interleukin-18-like n=1 Tax=Hyla sarda TaxID=327740 RepID=UPI0024C2BFC5|nr:interleukin-18-like [Hyla sarda]
MQHDVFNPRSENRMSHWGLKIDFDVSKILDEILHFEDELQTDSWKKSNRSITGMIENCFNQCLEARPDDPDGCSAVFTNPGRDQQTFELQLYRTNSMCDGLSVVFAVKCKNEKYYLCCAKDMKLYFKKGDCPNSIAGNYSDIIFFQKRFSEGDTNSFKFQSSLQPDYYLAFSDEGGKHILFLKKSCDELDETKRFFIK